MSIIEKIKGHALKLLPQSGQSDKDAPTGSGQEKGGSNTGPDPVKAEGGTLGAGSGVIKREPEGPISIGTNLIHGEVVTFFDWQRIIIIFTAFILIAVLIIGGVYVYLLVWEKNKKEEGIIVNRGLEKLRQTTSELEGDLEKSGVFLFRDKVAIASQLLDQHVYWTNFFRFLEDHTLANVYYINGFNDNDSGNYSLSAIAPDYYTVTQQIKAMSSSEWVSDVSAQSSSAGGEENDDAGAREINFSLSLSLKPELFRRVK